MSRCQDGDAGDDDSTRAFEELARVMMMSARLQDMVRNGAVHMAAGLAAA